MPAGADTASNGEGYFDTLSGFTDGVDKGFAVFDGSGDVEEDKLIGAGLVVGGGVFCGVADVFEVNEVYAFYETAVFDIEARNNPSVIHNN